MMLNRLITSIIVLGLASMVSTSVAADILLEKRYRLELEAGLLGDVSTTTTVERGNVTSSTESVGAMGSFTFSHWFSEDIAVSVAAGAHAVDIESNVESGEVFSRTATVVSMLIGIRYYFPKSTFGGKLRPYASVAAGPIVGTESETSVGQTIVVENSTRTALGVPLSVGLDLSLSRWFMLGANAGYNLMTDFSEPIGTRKNYSGPKFGISFSVIL